jgi:CPA1 family monovalent cation:H+ antiporter
VGQRHDATTKALDALRLQYPSYADDLERSFLLRLALRLEDGEYGTLFREGLIGQELYNDLLREVAERRARSLSRPRLDLGLNIGDLIQEVPMFADLSSEHVEKIAALLRPRVHPGLPLSLPASGGLIQAARRAPGSSPGGRGRPA